MPSLRRAGSPRAEAQIPSAIDPVWKIWAEPLYDFLVEARGFRDLFLWGRGQGHSRLVVLHLLAWLSLDARADFDPASRTWARPRRTLTSFFLSLARVGRIEP